MSREKVQQVRKEVTGMDWEGSWKAGCLLISRYFLVRDDRIWNVHADRVTVKIFSSDRAYTLITSPSIGKTTSLHPDLKRGGGVLRNPLGRLLLHYPLIVIWFEILLRALANSHPCSTSWSFRFGKLLMRTQEKPRFMPLLQLQTALNVVEPTACNL